MVSSLALSMLPPSSILFLAAASNTDIPGWLQYIQSGGVIGMFIVLVYALLTRKLVMGWTYDAMVKERDYYREIAYKTTDIASRQVATAEEMTRQMENIALRSEVMRARERDRGKANDE